MANTKFSEVYVKIAEATAASRVALISSVEPMSDTSNYLSTGLDGVLRVVVDTTVDTSWTDDPTISGTLFELANLVTANSAASGITDTAITDEPFLGIVTSINTFVVDNVLGVDGYSATLQAFIDDDCTWDSDPSAGAGAPTSWIELMIIAGFDVVDTNVD